MCLGEIGRVRSVAGPDSLAVDVGGRVISVSAMTLDSVPAVGDWVLVHSGFALAQLTAAAAHEALGLRGAAGERS
jgi:hydrogenase assembly chaperone HypC/HupF